ncbi:MAG: ribonuclease HI family protein [candidate division WOR-3 bacterium]
MAEYLVSIDGSSKFNPGPAGIGVLITRLDGSPVKEISYSIGIRTNNQAEYEALLCALRELKKLSADRAVIQTDSQLLYCQVTGRYRVKDPDLKKLHTRAVQMLAQLPGVSLQLVSRDENKTTDKLAKAAAQIMARTQEDGQR